MINTILSLIVVMLTCNTAFTQSFFDNTGHYKFETACKNLLHHDESVDSSWSNNLLVINNYDTVFFNLTAATCSNNVVQVPVLFKSDDSIFALDFSLKFNLNKLSYNSIVFHKPYLIGSANYNTNDSTLRFTSFSLQAMENNTPMISINFNLNSGLISTSDLFSITGYLNGTVCSTKKNPAPAAPFISPGGPTIFNQGDSVALNISNGPGNYSWVWSTGETTQSIVVDSSGLYLVTVTNPGGCTIVLSVAITVMQPLPVQMGDFNVIESTEGVVLSWQTFSELNNDFFTVERSVAGVEWNELARVDGAGTSSSVNSYLYIDRDPLNGLSYYRIKQTDFNGFFSFSGIKTINVSKNPGPSVIVFPNFLTEENILTLEVNGIEKSQVAGISVVNMEGKIEYQSGMEIERGKNIYQIKFNSLSPGRHFLVFTTATFQQVVGIEVM